MSEARGRSPVPKALTAALEHASNELEGVNIAHHSTPISQGRSLQEETLSMSQDTVAVGPQAHEPQPNQVPPEPTSKRFPIAPRYYLPSFIEDDDPMKDDEKLRCNITPPVENTSYGRRPVALFEPSPTIAKGWNTIPNEKVPKLRLPPGDLKPSQSPRHQSDLESIGEEQQLSVMGGGGVAGSPLWKRRAMRCGALQGADRTGKIGRPLNPEAEPFITARTDHGGHRLTGEERVEHLPGVTPSNMVTSSDEDPPPVWTQQEHPYSWKARLASGNTVIFITQDAYSLLTALDPIGYSLPYGSIVFGMKSTSEANLRASMKHGIWCSTGMGHNTLQRAWNKLGSDGQKIILLFSVSGSNKYCGMAEISGPVDSDARPGIWTHGSFRGAFPVRWVVCKDVTFVLFQDMMNPQNNNLPITTLRDATALPETLGRKVLQTYIEAPHYGNILLGSTSGSLRPGSLRPFIPIGPLGGLTAQSPAPGRPDIPMNVSLSPEALIRYDRQLPRRRLGYTPRVVGATNGQHSQPVPAKSHRLPRSPGHATPSRPGRVPGATNDTTKGGSNVGATGSGDDVGSESGDDIFWHPSKDS